jgi:hypothetical protein
MKLIELFLLAGLLVPALAPRQEQGQEGKPPKKAPQSSVTRFFKEQAERLANDVQGAWILFDYDDSAEAPMEGAATGFADFHDGFLTLIISIDTYEERLFRAREFTLLRTGAYRYRFDQQGALQLVNVISFTNQTPDGELRREASNQVFEYFANINEGLLELRNTDGVVLIFRKSTAGDFPEAAIRKLDSLRSGQAHWEDAGDLEEPR